jgi:hypothetical protein
MSNTPAMPADPLAYYNACARIVTQLRNFTEAFIRGQYSPEAAAAAMGPVTSVGAACFTAHLLGEPLFDVISKPPVSRGYNPQHLTDFQMFLHNVTVMGNGIAAAIFAYSALPATDTDKANAIMVLITEIENLLNHFRDPYNLGYAPLL